MKRLLWPALTVVALAGVAALVLLGLRGCGNTPDGPQIIGQVDTVPDTVLVASRPKIVTRWRDRIIIKTVPARVTISQGVPDTAWAMRYARAAIRADSVRRAKPQPDSVTHPWRYAPPKPILPPASGTYDGKHLTLWLTRSDGSLMRATAKLKPRWQFFSGTDAGSDSLPIFRSDRWFMRYARQAVKCAPRAALIGGGGGALLAPLNEQRERDRLESALVGAGLVLVGCLMG